ncbi:Hypothetical predicted protein [Mytilus galloprovincialis]|uniref:Integrase catalytic domain-containing protein n=1 Tax=Mytilus galloprovincialis TaxID=29158 RepID=A0A8B6C4T0_MYTGA|nr:Hypothetical predicted protein [Mytilus galloprovincialis]
MLGGGEFRMTCRVLARDTVVVPSNSSMTLPVNVPNKEHVTSIAIIEPCNLLYEEKNISVVSGIINSDDEYPFVQVVNYSDSDVKLYPNTMLGTCESVAAFPELRQDRCAGVNIIQSRQVETDENGVPEHLQDLLTRSCTHLTPKEKMTLAELLNKFQDVFSRSPEDIGRTNKIKHSIDTGDARPVRVPPRRLPIGKREIERTEVSKMLERGIIEPSNSPWSAPLVLITKPDLTTRVCVDFRSLNQLSRVDSYPVGRVDDCLEALSNSKLHRMMCKILKKTAKRDSNPQCTPLNQIRAVTRSRQVIPSAGLTKIKDLVIDGWDQISLRKSQLDDHEISEILMRIEDKKRPEWNEISNQSAVIKTLWRQWDRLEIHQGLLYRKWIENETEEFLQLIVPTSKRQEAIRYFHDIPTGGHLGIDKTLDRMQKTFYWPSMKNTIVEYIKRCDSCAAQKQLQARKAPMGKFLTGEPMERVAMDILGPLPMSKNNNRFVLVLSDLFTKWTEAYPLPDQEAKTVAQALTNEFISRFGTPLQLYSDQVTDGIPVIKTCKHRCNRYQITLPVQAFIQEPEIENESKVKPHEYVELLQSSLIKAHAYARKHLKGSQEYQKKYYDQSAKKRELIAGQPVWLHDPTRKPGVCSKLLPKWKGPFIVLKKIDDLIYMVKKSPRQPAKVYHIDRLIPYKGRNPPTWYKDKVEQK